MRKVVGSGPATESCPLICRGNYPASSHFHNKYAPAFSLLESIVCACAYPALCLPCCSAVAFCSQRRLPYPRAPSRSTNCGGRCLFHGGIHRLGRLPFSGSRVAMCCLCFFGRIAVTGRVVAGYGAQKMSKRPASTTPACGTHRHAWPNDTMSAYVVLFLARQPRGVRQVGATPCARGAAFVDQTSGRTRPFVRRYTVLCDCGSQWVWAP